jgi:hypothetical protein
LTFFNLIHLPTEEFPDSLKHPPIASIFPLQIFNPPSQFERVEEGALTHLDQVGFPANQTGFLGGRLPPRFPSWGFLGLGFGRFLGLFLWRGLGDHLRFFDFLFPYRFPWLFNQGFGHCFDDFGRLFQIGDIDLLFFFHKFFLILIDG